MATSGSDHPADIPGACFAFIRYQALLASLLPVHLIERQLAVSPDADVRLPHDRTRRDYLPNKEAGRCGIVHVATAATKVHGIYFIGR